MSEALKTWRKKLDYLQQQEAIIADPAQKFALAEQINEAKAKIAELEARIGELEAMTGGRQPSETVRRAGEVYSVLPNDPAVRTVTALALDFSYEQQLKAKRAIDAAEKFALTLQRDHPARELAIRRLQEFLISSPGFDARTDVSRRLRSQTMKAITALTNGILSPYFADREFAGQDLVSMDFRNTHLAEVSFEGSFLIQSNFSNANLKGACFRNAHIRNVKFIGAELEGADFSGADWFNATGFGAKQLGQLKGALLPCPANESEFHEYLGNHYAYSFASYSRDVQEELRAAWESCRGLGVTVSDTKSPMAGRPARPQAPQGESKGAPILRDLVYLSYSHNDKAWHRMLRRILDADPDIRDRVWDDTKITAGANFAKEIDAHVTRARVMIMLGSPDYFGANSGAAKCETQPALEAHRHGEMEILWLPVRAFTYSASPVGHLMAATGAGAVALEQLSTAEQRKELQKVRKSVRRCLGIPEPNELRESSAPRSIQRNMNTSTRTRTRKNGPSEKKVVRPDVSIGIITALPKEFVAMKALLLDCHEHHVPGQGAGRRYVLGRIPCLNGGDHRVALGLADMGNNIASARAALLLEHFNSVDAIIMVGIAGGVPFPRKAEDHVRLGDIVVSNKKGVVQYDMVKLSEVCACPIAPSAKLIEAVRHLEAGDLEGKRPWDAHLEAILKQLRQKRPASKTDRLYDSSDPATELSHPKDAKRSVRLPRVFLGPIASANELLKDPVKRDSLRDRFGVKAVEMEGSGIADATWFHEKGYLVVRGICDYCDSHKNDFWQEYAAATAAAYVRALIESVFVSRPTFVSRPAAGQNPR